MSNPHNSLISQVNIYCDSNIQEPIIYSSFIIEVHCNSNIANHYLFTLCIDILEILPNPSPPPRNEDPQILCQIVILSLYSMSMASLSFLIYLCTLSISSYSILSSFLTSKFT